MSRYSSSHDSSLYCSLDKLVTEIDHVYWNIEGPYESLPPMALSYINSRVFCRRFTLSPLKITCTVGEGSGMSSHILRLEEAPHAGFIIKAIPKDALVLTGLGLMLNSCIHLSNHFMENSLGLKVSLTYFYSIFKFAR